MGLSDLVTQLPELIGQAVEANQWLGYTAIFAAMFLENLFPPIPSELIMPLGGFYVQQGQLQLLPVVLAVASTRSWKGGEATSLLRRKKEDQNEKEDDNTFSTSK